MPITDQPDTLTLARGTFMRSMLFSTMFGLIASCAVPVFAESPKPTGDIGSLNSDRIIPSSEVPKLEERALRGDGAAADRLAFDPSRHDAKHSSDYWLTIGAEDGEVVAMYNLGVSLKDSKDPQDRARARYWLKLAAAHGFDLAESEVRELDRKEDPSLPPIHLPLDALPGTIR